MAIAFSRLDDQQGALVASMGFDPILDSYRFLGPADAQELIIDTANTPWVLTVASNLLSGKVTMDTGAELVQVFHQIPFPVSSVGTGDDDDVVGLRLKSFEVMYKVATATLTSADFKLIKTTQAVTGTIPTAAEVTCTGTELLTSDEHITVRTVTTTEIIDATESLHLQLDFTMKNTGVLDYFGTRLVFDVNS